MTLAERLREEGRAQGIEKGRMEEKFEVVKRLLAKCMDLSHIAELTDLSIEQIKVIKEEI